MKKNKMMRLASFLLVAVLLTTSVISGTFAKYVTTDTADDSARVARFGVEIQTEGSLFDKTYVNKDNGNKPGTSSASVTVSSSTSAASVTNNVVAPGTQSTDNGLIFSVTGKPEVTVDVKLTVDATSASDIWLGQGLNYPNMTTGEVFDASTENWDSRRADRVTFTASDYYPIKYTLQKSTDKSAWTVVDNCQDVSLSKIVTALQTLSDSASTTYGPGTDLSQTFGYYKLTWKWDFTDSTDGEITLTDKMDTLLGDLAEQETNYGGTKTDIVTKAITALGTASAGGPTANPQLTKGTPGTAAQANQYNLEAKLDFTITVTQVD